MKNNKHTAPSALEIANKVPLDEQVLKTNSLLQDGEKRARDYAGRVFDAEFGDDVAQAEKRHTTLDGEIQRANEELTGASEHFEKIERYLPVQDADKKPMPVITIVAQWFLGFIVALLLGIGVHNFAAILIKSGEPFMTNPWMAYVTALGGAFICAVIIKVLLSLIKRERTKRILAIIVTTVGLFAMIAYLAIMSNVVPTDFSDATVEDIVPDLDFGADAQAAGESLELPEVDEEKASFLQGLKNFGDYLREDGKHWMLFCLFLGESAGAAGIGYFIQKNFNDHRAACARRDPKFRAALKTVRLCEKRLGSLNDEQGQLLGVVVVFREARHMIIDKAVSCVLARKHFIQIVGDSIV